MNWIDYNEKSPEHREIVLICVSSVYYIATYNQTSEVFETFDRNHRIDFEKKHKVYWTELTLPDKKS